VGLGWTLNAGGTLVQIINEYDDFGSAHIDDTRFGFPAGRPECFGSSVEYSFSYGTLLEKEQLLDMKDSEPDFFRFQVLNYSGDFIFNKATRKFYSLDGKNFTVTSDLDDGSGSAYPFTFFVTVPEGHKFYFMLKDQTKITNSYGYGVPDNPTSPVDMRNKVTSRTYQLAIIYTNKGEKVYFEHATTAEIENYPGVSHTLSENINYVSPGQRGPYDAMYFPAGKNTTNFIATRQPFSYVTSIYSDKTKINFLSAAGRTDLNKAHQLNSIEVRDNSVYNTVVKRFTFSYDYFTSNTIPGNTNDQYLSYLNIAKTDNEKNLRLKLLSVEESGVGKYEFSYSPKLLPVKTSLAYDHWGFYNGMHKTQEFNRTGSNPNTIDAAILTGIKYPSGGTTTFEYEVNEIDILEQLVPIPGDESGTLYMSDNNVRNDYTSTFGANVYKVSDNAFWLMVPFRAEIDVTAILSVQGSCSANPNGLYYYPNADWEIRTYNEATRDLVRANGWSAIPSFVSNPDYLVNVQQEHLLVSDGQFKQWPTSKRILPAGVYYFRVGLNDQCGPQNTTGQHAFAYLQVKYSMDYTAIESQIPKGAGLRVKKIQDLTETGAVAETRRFTYEFPVLMGDIQYQTSTLFHFEYEGPDMYLYIIKGRTKTKHSNSIFAPSTNAAGKFVGYSSVIVANVNHLDNTTNGSTRYSYTNSRDQRARLDNVPLYRAETTNGLPLAESIYDKNGNKVQTTVNNYQNVILPCLSGLKSFWKKRIVIHTVGTLVTYDNIYDLAFYPITRAQTFLKSSEKSIFNGTKAVVTKQEFTYDAKNQIVSKKFTDSHGVVRESTFAYPYNLAGVPVYDDMVTENYIGEVVKKEEKLGGATSYIEKNEFKVIDNVSAFQFGTRKFFDKAKISTAYSATDPLQDEITFEVYDKDKIVQYKNVDGIVTTILWGYNKEYIIAKVEGASYAQVLPLFNNAILTQPYADDVIRTEIHKIRTGLLEARVTTYTHSPMIGVTSITDPNGRTEYYDYGYYPSNRLEAIRDHERNIKQHFQYKTLNR
jgi:hypothetical protein